MDGTTPIFYLTAKPLTINGKRYLTGVGLDISARKLAEDELVASRQRINSILDSMRRHCVYGCEILGPLSSLDEARSTCANPFAEDTADNEFLHLARTLALLHHERFDGQGYPFGLAGTDIPLEARIVAVVDVFDAVASHRSYKTAFPIEECLEVLRQGAGSQFDPTVVEAFFTHAPRPPEASSSRPQRALRRPAPCDWPAGPP